MSGERRRRVDILVNHALLGDYKMIDSFLKTARELWPYLHEKTLLSYSRAAMQISKRNTK